MQTSQDVERYLDFPVLCEIPKSHSCEYEKGNENHRSSKGRSEALNTLRTNIMFSGEDIRTILLTSTCSLEGKSLISLQLAKSFAENNKKCVYVDCDLRKSVTVTRYRIRGKVEGLTEWISGQTSNILYSTNIPNLYMVMSGHLVPKPIEMFQSRHFEDMLKALRKQFDYVILDAPSLGSVVDASVISQKVDGTVFVVRSDAVGRGEAQRAVKQLKKSGGRILGVALNGVGTHKGEYYYKYASSYKNYYQKE